MDVFYWILTKCTSHVSTVSLRLNFRGQGVTHLFPNLREIAFKLKFKNTKIIFQNSYWQNIFYSSSPIIFPGTNWCRAGTLATANSTLDSFGGADKCCRQHDLGCPVYIKTGNTKYGLYNSKLWTLNHCTCDERWGKKGQSECGSWQRALPRGPKSAKKS